MSSDVAAVAMMVICTFRKPPRFAGTRRLRLVARDRTIREHGRLPSLRSFLA